MQITNRNLEENSGMFVGDKVVRQLAGIACAVLLAAPAFAADGNKTLGLTAGTLGGGLEIGYRFGDKVGVRVNGGFFSYESTEEVDDIDYDGDLQLNSIGFMADWYPGGGGFRLSAGARANNNEIDLRAQPTAPVQIGNAFYSPQQIGSLLGTVKLGDSLVPMVSLGYAGKLAQGLTLGFELGVAFQGSAKIENLRTEGGSLDTAPFQQDIERERLRIEDDMSDYDLWPVLQIMLLYRF